ncbi:conserved Plasmodium protein, unknown function [Plasmodium gallinaceum]|uniref:Uncharacterized protein n=1 Tax=Plasmodium gallinaceum TaxID=5849 RepID=A0A1J1GLL7_PLAGA|nr:conserved Plasmodium protein, unknown function [Plasmodium gallinaceum]CRG93320.1 conserved Plasmodium protein, unknown function [Plasmodium gallinaceum]
MYRVEKSDNKEKLKIEEHFKMENKTINKEVKDSQKNITNENSIIKRKSDEFMNNKKSINLLNEEHLKIDKICENKEEYKLTQEKNEFEINQKDILQDKSSYIEINYNINKETNYAENTKNEKNEEIKNSKNEENFKDNNELDTIEKKELYNNIYEKYNSVKNNSFSSDKNNQKNDIKCVNDIKIDNSSMIKDNKAITKNYIKNIDIFKYNEKEKIIELHKNDKNTNINIYKRMYQSYILLKREHTELIEENRKKLETNKKLKYELENLKNNNYYSNFFFKNDSDNLFDDLASGFTNILKWINMENKIVQKNHSGSQQNNDFFFQNNKNSENNYQKISSNKVNMKKKKKNLYLKQERIIVNNDLNNKKKNFIKIENYNKEIQKLDIKNTINTNIHDKLNKNDILKKDTFKSASDNIIHNSNISENAADIKSITKKEIKDNNINNKNIDKNLMKNDKNINDESINNEKDIDRNLINKESFIFNDKVDSDKNISKNIKKKESFTNNENTISDNKNVDKSLISDKKLEESNNSLHLYDNMYENNEGFERIKNLDKIENTEKDNNTEEIINSLRISKKKERIPTFDNSKDRKIKKNSFLWQKENVFKKKEIKHYYNKEIENSKSKCIYKENDSLLQNDSINENIIDCIKKKLNDRIRNMNNITRGGPTEKFIFHICNYNEDKYIPLNLNNFFLINENLHSDIDLSLNHLKNIDFIFKKKKKKNLINKSNNIKKNILVNASNDRNINMCPNLTNYSKKNNINNMKALMNKNKNSYDNEIKIKNTYNNYSIKKKNYIFKIYDKNCNYENNENSKEKNFFFLTNIKEKHFYVVNKSSESMINKNFKNFKNKVMNNMCITIQKENFNFIINRINAIERKRKKNNQIIKYKFKLIKNEKNEILLYQLKKNFNYGIIFTNVLSNTNPFCNKTNFMFRKNKFLLYKSIINNRNKKRYSLKKKKKKIEIGNILKGNADKDNKNFINNLILNYDKKDIYKNDNQNFNENNINKIENAYKIDYEEEYKINNYDKNENIKRPMKNTKIDDADRITIKVSESNSNNEKIINIKEMNQEKGESNNINEKINVSKNDVIDKKIENYIFENNINIPANSEILIQFKELLKEHIKSLNILSKKIDKIENENNCEVIIIGIKLILNDKHIYLLVDALNSIENIVCKWINKNKEIIKNYIKNNSKIYNFFNYYHINLYIFFYNLLNILEDYIEQFPFYFSIVLEDLFYIS